MPVTMREAKPSYSVAPPATDPVTLDEAKEAIGQKQAHDDLIIARGITRATRQVEEWTGTQIMSATGTLKLRNFPNVIRVPFPPLQSVTSIQYVDVNGDTQTLVTSVYQVDTDVEYGLIGLVSGQSWPSTQSETFNAVTVTFLCGYVDADAVPEMLKDAITELVTRLYDNRGVAVETGDIFVGIANFQMPPWEW